MQNGVASNGNFSAVLPGAFNGSATARIRFYYTSALEPDPTGNRPAIAIDDLNVTATALGGSPTFSAAASVTGLNGTKNVTASGTSVTLNGSNLTSTVNASVTGPFSVSATLNGTYGSSATIAVIGGSPQTLFVRPNTATTGALTGSISYSGGGLTTTPSNTSLAGTVVDTEPTAQPALAFSNVTQTSLTLNVTGGNGGKVLIIGRSGSPYQNQSGFQASNQPADATAYAPNPIFASGAVVGTAGVYSISSGTATTVNVTGLTAGTQYSFVAFAYNDDNGTASAQNYLATGIPVNSSPGTLDPNVITATTDQAPGTVYTWIGAANGLWSTDTNWSPTRTTPATNDFLSIPAGSSILYDVAGDQTVGQLNITGTGVATLTLSGATSRTITVKFAPAGTDFSVPAGATLRLRTGSTTATGLNLKIDTGTTGILGGTLDINGNSTTITTNALVTVDGTLTVQSGGAVTVGSFATGASLSGTGTTFQNGSSLTKNGGTSPTATFQPTSTFTWGVANSLSLSGRTYGNLILNDFSNGGVTGASLLTINNLTFNVPSKIVGFNLTGGITITGNINVTAGTLNFQPATAGILTFSNSTATVTSVSPMTFSNLTLNKPNGGALVLRDVVVGATALTLGTSTNLNISEKLTFSSGAGITTGGNVLTLLSNATQTAYVVSTGAGTATATVQRATDGTGTAGNGYRFYASPVSGQNVGSFISQFGGVVNTAYNNATTPSTVTPFPTVFGYDPTRVNANTTAGFTRGYVSPDGTDVMTPGLGFSVYKNNSTVEFNGQLVQGAQTLTLAGNGVPGARYGWNLLGNPYPSALDWSSVTVNTTNIDRVAYTTRPTGSGPNDYVYVAYDNTPTATNKELPMAQGFFLRKRIAGAASVSLSNSNRVTTGDGNAFNRAAATTTASPALHLTLGQTGATVRPEAAVYFATGAVTGLDSEDSPAPGRSLGNAPTLLTLAGGEELAINYQNAAELGTTDVVVPVLIATPVSGQYKLDAPLLANIPVGTQVLLEDAVTGRSHDLTTLPSYSFHSDANYAGQRFTLRFTAGRVAGLNNDLSAAALSVWPNPASGTVRVSAPANTVVQLFDVAGRLVRTARIDAAATELNVSLDGLRAGFYTVRAGSASRKLVVE